MVVNCAELTFLINCELLLKSKLNRKYLCNCPNCNERIETCSYNNHCIIRKINLYLNNRRLKNYDCSNFSL